MTLNYELDHELYDRQIRTYGETATLKLNKCSVACMGLKKGLATEILKNLVLMGVNNIHLITDNTVINEDDLLTGYYYDTINKDYGIALAEKLKELNSSINVECHNNIINIITKIDILILINSKHISEINDFCRTYNIKFISLECSGNNGLIFVDAGLDHLITHFSDENYDSVKIINMENNIVFTNGHNFQTGDTVLLINKEYKINVINKTKFELLDFLHTDYLNTINYLNILVKYVNKSIIINHKTYNKSSYNYIQYDYEIISVNSVMGSLVSSEVIKLITNKYIPATDLNNQWIFWEDKIVSLSTKISESTVLIVGAGAIGCELLKNLAFLNIKKIIITDPDTIEKSNLSRQFLFREKDIGKLKSEIASKAILRMKPNIEIEYYSEKVGDNNINFINTILNNNITCVFNALDNIEARKFMDRQCFNYNLPLFESGTMGFKGNTQPIIPFLTETYSDTSDPDTEKTFPVCTIKNFPTEIHHTIHWALDKFEFFNRGPNNLNLWLATSELSNTNLDYIKDIWLFTTKYKVKNWYSCVLWAIDMFHENYYNQIVQLLKNFPKDTKNTDGTLFWSSRNFPIPITLNEKEELHIDFIESTTILLCNCLNFDLEFSRDTIYDIISKNKENNFVPQDIIIAKSDDELAQETISDESEILKTQINKELVFEKVTPLIFEKDNKSHIKWITATSNLRALNYSIDPITSYETKGIAGKIIPAIATTTSIVAGLITIEMLKYLNDNTDINKFNSTFFNLSTNMIISAPPQKCKEIEICNKKFNAWHKFIENENITIKQFIEKYNKLFNINIDIINLDNSIVYADFIADTSHKLLSEIISNNKNILTINSDDFQLDITIIL